MGKSWALGWRLSRNAERQASGSLAIVASALIVLSACARTANVGSGDGSAATKLNQAATATLAQKSFRAQAIVTTSPQGSDRRRWMIDYNAPDRARFAYGPPFGTTIVIGATGYLPVPGRPGYFYKQPDPANGADVKSLMPLGLLERATDVTQRGQTFRFRIASGSSSDGSASGFVRVSGGLIVGATIKITSPNGVTQTSVYTFSMFNSAPTISPPSADHVLQGSGCTPAPSPAPASVTICISPSPSS